MIPYATLRRRKDLHIYDGVLKAGVRRRGPLGGFSTNPLSKSGEALVHESEPARSDPNPEARHLLMP